MGGIKALVKLCGFNNLALQVFVLLGLEWISVLTLSHRLSVVLREVPTHQLLCVTLCVTQWLALPSFVRLQFDNG